MSVKDAAEKADIVVRDAPIVMQAKKARQAQLSGETKTKDGYTIRYHELSKEQIIDIIDRINHPTIIMHEKRRTEIKTIKGEKVKIFKPDRFVIFVDLNDGKEYVAVLEFGSKIDAQYLYNPKVDESYNTAVTVFKPDVERNGIVFDYSVYLAQNEFNEELDIKEEPSDESAAIRPTRSTAPSKESSKDSIHQSSSKNNPSEQNSSEKGFDKRKAPILPPRKAPKRGRQRQIKRQPQPFQDLYA